MALRHAVLTALLEGEASGYELAKRFDVSVANFWSTTPQQLYRELERLEAGGLLEARVVEQERRPNKRVFRMTQAGRDELYAFTAAPTRPTAIRDELLIKLAAIDEGDTDAVVASIAERVEQARRSFDRYRELRDGMLAGRSEEQFLHEADRIGPYLTLVRGMVFERENWRLGESVLRIVAERQAARAVADAEAPTTSEAARTAG